MKEELKKTNSVQSVMDKRIETMKIQSRNEICSAEQWTAFCNILKQKAKPVVLCVVPGASSELVYDAFLQAEIIPQAIFCPDKFHALYGRELISDSMPDMEECIWCLAGARLDVRIDEMYEEIVRRQGGYSENVYLLSRMGCTRQDTGLRHMICHCRKVVLMGEIRICGLLEKYCHSLGEMKITYISSQNQVEAIADGNMEALWFYVDIPSKEMPGQYRGAYEVCKQNGIYLSRYFADHFMWYENEWDDSCFTQKEITSMECLKQMQAIAAERDAESCEHDGKRHILFLAPEHSYIWYGVVPLFQYYMKRENTICTVVFPYIWNILKIGERNLKETAVNISEIRRCGGIVRFDNNWCPDREYEACYLNLGVSQWYYSGIGADVRKTSMVVISLQSIAYHTHYYAGNDEFEGMFAEKHREQIDYAMTSCFMAEWAAQKEEKWRDKLLPFGYPRMDALYKDLRNSRLPEQWVEKKKGKKVIYFNGDFTLQLFQYCYDYCKKDKAVLIWRPHPYDFDTPHAREQIEKLEKAKNVIVDTNQSYEAAFNISDALVTSFCSSVLINYLFTDKPVLILDKSYYNLKDNKIDFRDEAWYKAAYVTNDEEAGRKFIDMIMDGRDDKKVEKLPYRKFMQQGFDGEVCERIAAFADTIFQSKK